MITVSFWVSFDQDENGEYVRHGTRGVQGLQGVG